MLSECDRRLGCDDIDLMRDRKRCTLCTAYQWAAMLNIFSIEWTKWWPRTNMLLHRPTSTMLLCRLSSPHPDELSTRHVSSFLSDKNSSESARFVSFYRSECLTHVKWLSTLKNFHFSCYRLTVYRDFAESERVRVSISKIAVSSTDFLFCPGSVVR